ncbi:MAG: hypothetical protein IKB79_05215 [Oscillospiraceae bacterium]|nr:hypothetical protein [Oscillospiraceae bacterium]
MRVADFNEDHMHEFAHTQDHMLLIPIPARPKTLLFLAAAGIAFVAIVAALVFLLPQGDRTDPQSVAEQSVHLMLQEERDNIQRVTAVEMAWVKEKGYYTHVTYVTKAGETLQRVYYLDYENPGQRDWFDPAAPGDMQAYYDGWQAAKEKGVLSFTPEELENLL